MGVYKIVKYFTYGGGGELVKYLTSTTNIKIILDNIERIC